MKRWLAAMMALVLLLMLLPVSSMAAQYATVTGGWLRLRSAPSFDAQTLASYYTGTVVEIIGTTGAWYNVRLTDGYSGYMHSDYLTLGAAAPGTGSTGGSTTPSGVNATVVSSNGYGVRLRMGPGTYYRVIRKFEVGTPCVILQQGSYWCKISIEGYTGYMMTQFLSTSGSTGGSGSSGSVSYVGDATIWSSNGYGVRLRTGPGKEYSKIGVYSVGTQVKIITRGAVWDYIQVGSRRGYMMNEFLIYNNNYTVTGVTINNQNPVVGNVLAVQSVTPSTATVTYQWLVTPQGGKETVKGTSAAYLVTDADVGATIRLKVTGAGRYSGTAYSAATAKVVKTGVVEKVELNITTPYVGNVLRPILTPEGATVSYFWSVGGVQKSNESTYTVTQADVGKTITLRVDGKYPFSGTKAVTTNVVQAMEAPVIVNNVLPNATYQAAYSKQISATGGGTRVWSIVKGSLPAGLSLSQNGIISGVPTESGTKTFTVQVINEIGKATKQLTLTVDPARVNLPNVNGVAVPVKNAEAVKKITSTAQYSGSVSWSPALTDGKFAADTAYTATISLKAKEHYTFTGLTSSFFKVEGSNNVSCTIGADGSTATVTAVFPATAASTAAKLSKPTVTGITQQDGQWIISWSKVANASGYMFRRAGDSATPWQKVTGTSYTFEEKPASATYQVYALGDGVSYDNSDVTDYVYTAAAAPAPVKLATPTGLSIQENNGTWTATWNAVEGASGYRFQRVGSKWHDCSGTSYTFVNKPAVAEYLVYAVGDGVSYTDSSTASLNYTGSQAATPQPTQLAAPANLSVKQQDGEWILDWDDVPNASGYKFRQTNGTNTWRDCTGSSYSFVNAPKDGDSYEVYAVGDGAAYTDSSVTAYTYTVAATEPEPAPEPVKLGTPTGLSIQENGGVWTATWNSVENASGYKFRKVGSSWHSCSGTSYTFKNTPATADYEVYAVGDGASYTDGDIASLSYEKPAVEAIQLGTPAGLSIQESGGVWTATWNSVEGASGYKFRKVGSSWHSCSGTSYTFKNPPSTGDYEVYAVGDGTVYTDSNAAFLSYTKPETASDTMQLVEMPELPVEESFSE